MSLYGFVNAIFISGRLRLSSRWGCSDSEASNRQYIENIRLGRRSNQGCHKTSREKAGNWVQKKKENVDCTKARPGKNSLIDGSFNMSKEGTFTMISRVVVVRHLGGLLCAVGPMVSLVNLSSLHTWGSRVVSRRGSDKQWTLLLQKNARTEIIQNQILHLGHYPIRWDSRPIIMTPGHAFGDH